MTKLSNKYHKIQSLFKRNIEGDNKFIIGAWTTPELYYLKDNTWEFTEKVDGMNMRVMFNGQDVTFGGRSDNAQIPAELFQRMQMLFQFEHPLSVLKEVFGQEENLEVVLYGEGFGAGIQKAGVGYGQTKDFVLFDVMINGMYLERNNVDDIAKKLGIKSVPIIGYGTLNDAIEMVKKGFKSQWGDFIAEGIVTRPTVELFTRRGERIITKVKYCDFN